VKEEVHILEATLLENPKGPQCNRRDALTKNLCVNLLGFMGVYGKSKDTMEAR
jgi:hypothetical protein